MQDHTQIRRPNLKNLAVMSQRKLYAQPVEMTLEQHFQIHGHVRRRQTAFTGNIISAKFQCGAFELPLRHGTVDLPFRS